MSLPEKLRNGFSVTPTQTPLVTYPLWLQICSASHSSWWKTDVIVLVLDIYQGYSKNILMMMCYQKTPQMGIRQLLCCVKARWTLNYQLFAEQQLLMSPYWRWGMKLSLAVSWFFFHSIFQQILPLSLEGYCPHGPGGRAAGGGRLPDLWTPYLCKRLTHFLHSKFCGIVYRPLVVHCHGHLPICPIWACPWAKNLSNLPQIGSRIADRISETSGWMYPI